MGGTRVTRRQALAALAAAPAANLLHVEPTVASTATFVLVHGAWHGGWCWKKVAPLLRAAGHDVYAPTLTGLGERSHLLSHDVGLDTHVQDIVNVLAYEELR